MEKVDFDFLYLQIIQAYSGHIEAYPNSLSKVDSKTIVDLSRAVQRAINDMKRKTMKLEEEACKQHFSSSDWRL